MRPSTFRLLFGVLLCLLLTVDAVGAATAAVRGLAGGCTHMQTANAAMGMPAHRHGAHSTMAVSTHAHEAMTTHAADHATHGSHPAGATPTHDAQLRDAQAHHGHVAAADHPQHGPAAHDDAAAPGDDCGCDDGGCACPAACSLVLAAHAFPTLGARAPDAMRAGLPQHTRPAPPQPDALRPPIG